MKETRVARVLNQLTTWFPVVLLAVLAALTYWLDAQVQRGDRTAGIATKEPDYYLEDFSAKRFGKDGGVVQQVAAKKMTHYPEGTPTEVVSPHLINTPPGKAPLRVTADAGRITSDNEHVYLTGNVVGVREAYAGHGKLTVSTEYVHVRPREERADGNKRVTIVDDNGTHVGNAFEVDNKARTVRLRNGVTGEIQAQPK